MRGVFEFTGFAGLALALHVAAFQGLPQGSESAGSGSDASVTVAAVSGSLSEMVATWDRPPVVSEVMPAALPQPAFDHDATAATSPDAMELPATKALPRLEPVLPMREAALPQDATQSAPPPPVQQVDLPPKIRPQARPASQPAKPKPVVSQTPRAASTAAGSGAMAERGTHGPAETASLNQGTRQTLMAAWGGKIRNRIDAAKPRGSGRGSVTVLLTIAHNGKLHNLRIAASSGQDDLDQRALRAVKSAGQFPAAPSGLTDATYSFRLPIRFD